MSDAITITQNESGSKGRYEARVDGHVGRGEWTYSRISPSKIIADHTGVDDSLRGTGVARLATRIIICDYAQAGSRSK